ncbi:MAG: hypothetical protein INR73_26565 [Williamsia sp.]|nr:hypothetical protein [Williamsia sp.]
MATQSDINQINYSQDGQIWSNPQGNQHYLIDQGIARQMPKDRRPPIFKRLQKVTKVFPNNEFAQGIPINSSSRLISDSNTGRVYFEDVDAKGAPLHRWISCPAALDYTFDWNSVQPGTVTNPGGPDILYHELDGLMTADSSGAIYLHDQGVARHIPDSATYLKLFCQFKTNSLTARDNYYHVGRPLPRSTRLIVASSGTNQPIYLQDENEDGTPIKRRITGPEVYNYYFFHWGKVQKISLSEVENMRSGPWIFYPQNRFKGIIGSISLKAEAPYSVYLHFKDVTQNGRELDGSGMITQGRSARINPEDFGCKHNDIIQLKMKIVGGEVLTKQGNNIAEDVQERMEGDCFTATEEFIFQSGSSNVANYQSEGSLTSMRFLPLKYLGISS